ncbi:uncharacterized protein LOC131631739 [Vicia villosa]|uniref:uncharacterized protein LOC131631739 n=1 Tax=Vicia villosa TaxID=3911 RepID=UPI00273C2203|nr:uncharacterized protein LOC131631739 [Vicia villosa]
MVIDTLAKGSVTTFLVYLHYSLSIFDRDFGVDLIFMLLRGLNVILGMNWLESNHVHINFYDKLVHFLAPIDEEEAGYLSARQLKGLLQDEARLFVLFASLPAKSQVVIDKLTVVPYVFPDDV